MFFVTDFIKTIGGIFDMPGKDSTMEKRVKEIWIKFNSQTEYSGNAEKLSALLEESPGDSTVIVYDVDTRGRKRLECCGFDETRISILEDAFGKDNVKYQERKMDAERDRPYVTPVVRQIVPCNHDMYAVLKDSSGGEYKCKVLLYALCDDGEVYPLFFDNGYGVCFSCDAFFDADRYELKGGEIYLPPESVKSGQE